MWHIDLRNAIEIADAAIHDEPVDDCSLHDVVEQVIAKNRAVTFFPNRSTTRTSRLQHVDGSLIEKIRQSTLGSLGLGDLVHIRSQRHELHCEGAPTMVLRGRRT